MLLARRWIAPPISTTRIMAMSYSAAASQGGSNNDSAGIHLSSENRSQQPSSHESDKTGGQRQRGQQRRSPSPAHVPKKDKAEEDVYVLTLLTDQAHHKRMTAIRDKYFPKKLNKLGAHLTLFHALPGSRLDDQILPTIREVASKTASFDIHAVRPFRLKRGMALSVAKNHGSLQAQEVHEALQRPWLDAGFLSEQDRGGCRVHYTVMNKVEDEAEVANALQELQNGFQGDWGRAEGLGLWRYDRGWWRWEQRFNFSSEREGS